MSIMKEQKQSMKQNMMCNDSCGCMCMCMSIKACSCMPLYLISLTFTDYFGKSE